jgi:enoyl-CoA hydratase
LTGTLEACLTALDADPAVKAVVLTGAGANFAAGADLKEMLPMTAAQVMASDFTGCCHRLADLGKPVIAAVSGLVLGGGCELVEMCDLVIAADTARFGHPEITVGTMPGAGGTQRLPKAVGKHVAMDMLLTGRVLTAEEALGCGLVSRVVGAERLLDEALAVARQIASFSAPVARMIKEAVNRSFAMPLPEGLALERRLFHLTFALDDRKEGMAAFVGKRRPAFQDR